ncbi:MAG: hypothetical protein HQM02_08430 [Magnetococcales bacterium]|nr:hypothetical protein [Magnetococcales bacterium]
MRLLILLAVAGALAYYVMRRRNIRVSLTPLGRNALVTGVRALLRMLLRRIGW